MRSLLPHLVILLLALPGLATVAGQAPAFENAHAILMTRARIDPAEATFRVFRTLVPDDAQTVLAVRGTDVVFEPPGPRELVDARAECVADTDESGAVSTRGRVNLLAAGGCAYQLHHWPITQVRLAVLGIGGGFADAYDYDEPRGYWAVGCTLVGGAYGDDRTLTCEEMRYGEPPSSFTSWDGFVGNLYGGTTAGLYR